MYVLRCPKVTMEEVTQHKLKELRIILDSNEVKNYFQIQKVKIKEEVVSDDEPTDLQPIAQVYLPEYQIKSEVVDSTTLAVKQLEEKHEDTQKLFSCSLCKKDRMKVNHFKRHLTMAHQLSKDEILKYAPEFYQCKYCPRQFKAPSKLNEHMGSHTLSFKCDQCDKRFGQNFTLQQHKLTHSEPQYSCPHCDKKFILKGNMNKHINCMHNDNKCGTQLKRRKRLVKRIKFIPNPENSLKCDECGKCFALKSYLRRHIVDVHLTISKNYLCSYCNVKFKTNNSLKFHIKTIHNRGVLVESNDCSIQPRNYSKTCNDQNTEPVGQILKLQNQHIRKEISKDDDPEIQPISEVYMPDNQEGNIKTGVNSPLRSTMTVKHLEDKHEEKKILFSCSLCKRNNMVLASFKQHLTVTHHLNNEESFKYVPEFYKCKYCPSQFKVPYLLRKHEGSHTLPFKCDQCDSRFGQKFSLKVHKLIHSSEPQLPCPHCKIKFRQKCQLTNHIESVHSAGEVRKHKCDQCEKEYKCRRYLMQHVKHYHINLHQKSWKCDKCGKCFKFKHLLKQHILNVHLTVSKNYRCSHCTVKFKLKGNLKHHINLMHNNGVSIESNKCSRVTRNRPKTCNDSNSESVSKPGVSEPVGQLLKLQNHYIKEEISEDDGHEIRPISEVYMEDYQEGNIKTEVNYPLESTMTDDIEIETEITIDEMDLSTLKIEEGTENGLDDGCVVKTFDKIKKETVVCYKCDHCKKKLFESKEDLINHIQIVHLTCSKITEWKCDECGKYFKFKEYLNSHKSNVHSEPKFCCVHCGKKFKMKSALNVHIESLHSGGVCKYKCDQCDKKFKCRNGLRNHIQCVHSVPNKNSWKCDECGKCFKLKQYLKRHVDFVHVSNAKFSCTNCGKKYKQSCALKQHINRHHSGDVRK